MNWSQYSAIFAIKSDDFTRMWSIRTTCREWDDGKRKKNRSVTSNGGCCIVHACNVVSTHEYIRYLIHVMNFHTNIWSSSAKKSDDFGLLNGCTRLLYLWAIIVFQFIQIFNFSTMTINLPRELHLDVFCWRRGETLNTKQLIFRNVHSKKRSKPRLEFNKCFHLSCITVRFD